jgi:hypothetical protein
MESELNPIKLYGKLSRKSWFRWFGRFSGWLSRFLGFSWLILV